MNQQDQATLIIAIIGMAIASLSFALSVVLGIFEICRHQPHIKVKVGLGFMGFRDGEMSEPFIITNAINCG
jgi:uncharacterized integral membrane protein